MNLELFAANGIKAQAAVDAAAVRKPTKKQEAEQVLREHFNIDQKLRAISRTPFLNAAAVRKFLLDHAKHSRAHTFTRVSEQTLIEINESVRAAMVGKVRRLPSKGKTI